MCPVKNCERSLRSAAHELRKLKLESEEDVGQILDFAVSVNAGWQKRYFVILSHFMPLLSFYLLLVFDFL